MSYKLYSDKNENFECEVSVKNASLKGSIARVIVESSDGTNLIFNGKIENGKCTVPIKRLHGLLEENSKGNMFLEVIVEGTYFKPWKSEFVVEEHTSVKVTLQESKISSKPSVSVSNPKTQGINMWLPLQEITSICRVLGITRSNLHSHRSDFKALVSEYFNSNPEFKNHQQQILSGLKHFMV